MQTKHARVFGFLAGILLLGFFVSPLAAAPITPPPNMDPHETGGAAGSSDGAPAPSPDAASSDAAGLGGTIGGSAAPTQAKATPGRLNLSGLSETCMSNGNCSLDDIVKTGASFANLLTELSAAFFFATFVYGGAMYLLSFGDKGRVDKGKKALTGAAIGMTIVLMAWTIVNYIATSLLGK